MSRKSDKHKPPGKSIIANRVELDRYQMPTKKPSDPPQLDMGKYIVIYETVLKIFYLFAITPLFI